MIAMEHHRPFNALYPVSEWPIGEPIVERRFMLLDSRAADVCTVEIGLRWVAPSGPPPIRAGNERIVPITGGQSPLE